MEFDLIALFILTLLCLILILYITYRVGKRINLVRESLEDLSDELANVDYELSKADVVYSSGIRDNLKDISNNLNKMLKDFNRKI